MRNLILRKENNKLLHNVRKNWQLYLMFAFPFIWFFVFCYIPMSGLFMAFTEYELGSGIIGFFTGEWVGFKYFEEFIDAYYFADILRNTIVISLLDIAVNFTLAIVLALMFDQIVNKHFKKIAQTISYLPKFISMVVIVSIFKKFLSLESGVINNVIAAFGGERIYFLAEPNYFWILLTLMNTWATVGWSSIIYVSAISGISTELYEACEIDGGGTFTKMRVITLPGIQSTITIMLILRMGSILSVGLEPVLLLANDTLYKTAEVISLHVYNRGVRYLDYSYGTAVGLFQSLIGFILVVITNKIAKKMSDYSLW